MRQYADMTGILNWLLSSADAALKVCISIATLGTMWWKWRGKKWYDHYRKGRNTWRDALLEIQKDSNQKIGAMGLRIGEIEKQLKPNGGSSLVDKVDRNSDILDQLIVGQRITRETLDLIHWESDAYGRVTYASQNLCDLLGCDQKELLGTGWVGSIKESERRRVFENWKQSVADSYSFKDEFSFMDSDGNEVKVKASARHNKDNKQKLISSLVKFTVI